MLTLDFPWALLVLPLPLLARLLLPAYGERVAALRVPFFAEIASYTGATTAKGTVVRRSGLARLLVPGLCWLLIVAAMARPAWIFPPVERVEAARDILLAVDLSQSMETRDFTAPDGQRLNRLEAVKRVVSGFIARRKDDRIGLIVFGTMAFPQAPLTLDHDSVKALLDATRIGMAGPQTAIGDAIGIAVRMAEKTDVRDKVLILLTDGNDTASRLPPDKAASIAHDKGLVIDTVAIGDPAATGEARVDLAALHKIAATTGGQSFRGEDLAGLERIYATLDAMMQDKAKHYSYRPKRSLFHLPLGAAGVLLALYYLARMVLAAYRQTRLVALASSLDITQDERPERKRP